MAQFYKKYMKQVNRIGLGFSFMAHRGNANHNPYLNPEPQCYASVVPLTLTLTLTLT